ncbi:uncharacterized protein FIBRA_03509 [Fibroporia radiculosa]|uniref:F-box domain-containing protein n=1 Tax=Fibroporia radiculosa TaxID=599839 RepID=J4I9N2_9APHY|nr:uncharacterized protein FIBRA_03509 [Fibroporia radiculosa]CCM01456.1 predicted protein [Fibroporia radiculosa]
MPTPTSFLTIPGDVLVLIASELAALDPLGPPSLLVPLLLTCKSVHSVLSFHSAHHLYARIFRARFDTRAAFRRMGPRAMRSHNLAIQLKRVSRMLARVRRGDLDDPHIEQDLWTAFIMCTENDGKNSIQLDWANVDDFVLRFISTKLWEDRIHSNGWPAESSVNALAIWVYWMRLDQGASPPTETVLALNQIPLCLAKLQSANADTRNQILDLIRPYMLTALRYPSFHAPDNHFDFPLPEELQNEFPYTLMTPHGFYPLYRQPMALQETFSHFGLPLMISAPLIAQGAKLLYMTLHPTRIPYTEGQPTSRAHSLQLGLTHVHPTRDDVDEANARMTISLVPHGEWDWRSKLKNDEGMLEDDGVWRRSLLSVSSKWDNDWNRLTGCFNPWIINELKGVVYTYGTLNGLWRGRMLVPDMSQYIELITSTQFPSDFSITKPRMMTYPLYMRLREHHCINPETPTAPGGSTHPYDDGICNAWFPTGTRILDLQGCVRVLDEAAGGEISTYETYVEGRENSHSEVTCTQCIMRREDEEADLRGRVRAHVRAASGEDEDEEMGEPGVERGTGGEREGERGSAHAYASGSGSPPHSHADWRQEAEEVQALREEANALLGRDVDELLDEEMGDAETEDEYIESSDDSDGEECIVNTCNGVCDIIVTGETLSRHAQAWHQFRFYGRVRKWDGLVAIVRVPVLYPQLGTFIFRGYVVGNQNFVGSWRAYTNNLHAIPFEGPFAMSRAPMT